MSLRVAGIQPGYLPWLGYFDQMLQADVFVIADEMPFSRSGWVHRNRVLGPNGVVWLRLPIQARTGQAIDTVALRERDPWARTHIRTMRQAYSRFGPAGEELARLAPVLECPAPRLVDVVVPTLDHLVERLGITTPIVRSSELGLEDRYREQFPDDGGPTQRVIAFVEALGGDQLLEGETGASYLDVDLCRHHGIEVAFHRYDHPEYPQRGDPFTSHLSAVDLLLTHGARRAREIIRS